MPILIKNRVFYMEAVYLIAYYFLLPAVIIPLAWHIYQEKKTLDMYEEKKKIINDFRSKEEISRKSLIKKIKAYQIILFILIIIILSSWHVTAVFYTDYGMHRELYGSTHPITGPAYAMQDPVTNSIGPSYDVDEVISEMKDMPERWDYEQIDDGVDFDELTKYPGALAVYRMERGRIVVTYTYVSPFPMVRTFGFQIKEVAGEDIFILMREDTIIFPQSPHGAGEVLEV